MARVIMTLWEKMKLNPRDGGRTQTCTTTIERWLNWREGEVDASPLCREVVGWNENAKGAKGEEKNS